LYFWITHSTRKVLLLTLPLLFRVMSSEDLAWYALPFTLATTMGIAAIALESTPAFHTYPNRMTTPQIGAGLVLPYAAQTIDGVGGAGAGESITYPVFSFSFFVK
jgi:hypothetical protein